MYSVQSSKMVPKKQVLKFSVKNVAFLDYFNLECARISSWQCFVLEACCFMLHPVCLLYPVYFNQPQTLGSDIASDYYSFHVLAAFHVQIPCTWTPRCSEPSGQKVVSSEAGDWMVRSCCFDYAGSSGGSNGRPTVACCLSEGLYMVSWGKLPRPPRTRKGLSFLIHSLKYVVSHYRVRSSVALVE